MYEAEIAQTKHDLAAGGPKPERVAIDSTRLKASRTAARHLNRGSFPLYRPQKGGLNSKLHVAYDDAGEPLL